MKNTIVIIFLIIMLSMVYAKEINVGVSPGFKNIGEIEPGESRIVRFSLVTPSDDVFLVYLYPETQEVMSYTRENYETIRQNISEQNMNEWIDTINNPVELNPLKDEKTAGGRTIKKASEAVFIVHVPEDAEPGYHLGRIKLDPQAPPGGEGGIGVKAVSNFGFLFNVPGIALRRGEIIDVAEGGYYPDGRFRIKVFFQNTGTVTIITRPGELVIKDKYGRVVENLRTSSGYVRPGETSVFEASFVPEGLEYGEYDVEVTIDYNTGFATKKSKIELYPPPKEIPIIRVVEKERGFPWWVLILVIIIITGYWFYRR